MVLSELGQSITSALRKMTNSTVIDDAVVDELCKEICKALLMVRLSFAARAKCRPVTSGINVLNRVTINTRPTLVCVRCIQADVNVKLVQSMRANIKKRINLEEIASGVNRRKVIQSVQHVC